MNEFPYSIQIQALLDDYYNNRIGMDEYRQQRTQLLDEIDKEVNGTEREQNKDSTDSTFIGKMLNMIKNSNTEETTN
ncbi:MAG: hypothetical protein OEZ33_06190 [Gammaproteobacteria bacterium]|nr:hypothetical protein [Gammaproteobacteria bacterium]MDH5777781.1 hypothetical protein [Gammaproteobacteria bacterium]